MNEAPGAASLHPMIKQFIDKLLGKSGGAATRGKTRFGKRQEVAASVHGINPALVDERAKNVVTTLQEAGFEAYIVGGAVRDLLLGLRPKDFDVATNATPEQVKGDLTPEQYRGEFGEDGENP